MHAFEVYPKVNIFLKILHKEGLTISSFLACVWSKIS